MEALQENEALILKASSSRENQHTKGREHSDGEADNDKANKIRVHDKLRNLANK